MLSELTFYDLCFDTRCYFSIHIVTSEEIKLGSIITPDSTIPLCRIAFSYDLDMEKKRVGTSFSYTPTDFRGCRSLSRDDVNHP